MADNREGEENAARGNEWEVVSLTASTYAASPGPKQVELENNDTENASYDDNEGEISRALFMSQHFILPPDQHGSLPLEADHIEPENEAVGKKAASEIAVEGCDKSCNKDDDEWKLKGLNMSDDFQFFDEKVNVKGLSISAKEFEESTKMSDLHLSDKECSLYSTTAFNESLDISDIDIEPSERRIDPPVDISPTPRRSTDGKQDGFGLPCEAWWKRTASSLYAQAKDANALWSIFIAAAMVGIVLLGQRWQQEKWQVVQIKWQVSLNNEKSDRMLGPISRLKDAIVGEVPRGSLIREASSSDN